MVSFDAGYASVKPIRTSN